ncbi:hypothetical protein [Enterococcus faecalis]|uniref:hypothetical protein n=1 Tax=Enterococcus faecalis TaxID=1351 RepID=UPI0004599A42|nr:hypothetical protein [Enterococcus faecalis]KAJ60556.1 hypothetical protein P785_1927 [Enterococcus faecalis KS19]
MTEKINKKIVDSKKQIDRLIDKRSENLGDSINYIINENKILELNAKIEAYEEVIALLSKN